MARRLRIFGWIAERQLLDGHERELLDSFPTHATATALDGKVRIRALGNGMAIRLRQGEVFTLENKATMPPLRELLTPHLHRPS